MGLFKKEENWWLRLTIVLITLIWLSSLSVMNKEVIIERKVLTDSLSYYKSQNDSLKEENGFQNNQIGLRDMIIEEVKTQNPKMIDEILKNTEGFAYEK
jgi:hypothetical protein